MTQLAKEYGTPLYLMDEARIRANCRMYLQAFRDHFGPGSLPLYASKAASFKQMYRIMAEEGMGVDVVSSGELYTALSAGFPAERIYFHGNCKTDADLAYGVSQGIGFFVADNREELLALEKTAAEANVTQKILLRVTPGIDPHTYEARQYRKGGLQVRCGGGDRSGHGTGVKLALTLPHLDLRGLHCHVGSQVFGEDVYQRTLDIMVPSPGIHPGGDRRDAFRSEPWRRLRASAIPMRTRPSTFPPVWRSWRAYLKEETERLGLPMPRFLMEPGRSIVAGRGG